MQGSKYTDTTTKKWCVQISLNENICLLFNYVSYTVLTLTFTHTHNKVTVKTP